MTANTTLLLDAHVHLYDCFDLEQLLLAAQQNFERVVSHMPSQAGRFAFCLLCVDLQDKTLSSELDRLSALNTYEFSSKDRKEKHAITVKHRSSGFSMQIVWGYQIITDENIEVLAFDLPDPIPNGTPLGATLDSLNRSQSLAILPWGFGKWSGKRGELIKNILAEQAISRTAELFVGDNGGRWRRTSESHLIKHAQQAGMWNIPGSDPLPFPVQASRPGSRGVVLHGNYDQECPTHSIRQLLQQLDVQPDQFGDGETLLPFLLAQLGMQWRKQLRKRQR